MTGTDIALIVSAITGLLTLIFQNLWKGWTDARNREWDRADRDRLRVELSQKTEAEATKLAQTQHQRIDAIQRALTEQSAQAARDATAIQIQVDRNTQRLDATAEAAARERAAVASVAAQERLALTTQIESGAKAVAEQAAVVNAAIANAHSTIETSNNLNQKLLDLTAVVQSVQAAVDKKETPA